MPEKEAQAIEDMIDNENEALKKSKINSNYYAVASYDYYIEFMVQVRSEPDGGRTEKQ